MNYSDIRDHIEEMYGFELSQGKIISKAYYTLLGMDMQGRKDLLGLYSSENEGAGFWMQVLSDLQNRGVEDIQIALIDNLKGFVDAIEAMYPKTEVQLCIAHQIRNSLRYVASKDQKPFLCNLKRYTRLHKNPPLKTCLVNSKKPGG